MRRVRVSAEASREFQEAADWYEGETPGLGFRLIDAVEHAIELLREDFPPQTSGPDDAGHRGAKRLILHRFPFSIITIEQDGEFVVLALAHHSRRPDYWKNRLPT